MTDSLPTDAELAALADAVHFEFTWPPPALGDDDEGAHVQRSTIRCGFETLEQARAFRDALNESIAAAARRGDEASAWSEAPFAESTDAQEWARAFLERFSGERVGVDEPVDEGLLIAWFANAIGRGRAAAWPTTPRPAGLIRVVREGRTCRLEVDGRPFPWHTSGKDGWKVHVARTEMPGVELTLLAERVLVDDDAALRRGAE